MRTMYVPSYSKYVALRDGHNVKDATIASATGISRGTFSSWSDGSSYPKLDKIVKIANYFNVAIEDIIEEKVYEN